MEMERPIPTTDSRRNRTCMIVLSTCLVFFICTSVALAIAFGIVGADWRRLKDNEIPTCGANLAQDDAATFKPTQAEMKASVFDELSADEIDAVVKWMNNDSGLSITPVPDGTVLNINYVTGVELFPLVKADVLLFLDGSGSAPSRYARVFVTMGAETTPEAREYKVGPLGSTMTKTLVRTIPYDSRKTDYIEYGLLDTKVVVPAADKIKTLMQESFGADYSDDCGSACLSWTDSAPRGNSTGDRKTWIWFMFEAPGRYEHAVELSFRIQHEGPDPAAWKVISVVYNYQTFDSVDKLATAYANNNLRKVVMIENQAAMDSSTLIRRDVPPRPLEKLPVPRQVYPAGPRFAVTGNHVNYLGWSFQVTSRPSAGLQFFDVRFKDERILYEMSVQEAFASYGGLSPYQSNSVYMDSYWGMGTSTWTLMPGIDCPENAVFLDQLVYQSGSDQANYIRLPGAVCVFEHNMGIPLRRHYDNDGAGSFNFVGGAPSVALIVRVCAAVYNYDYVYDFIFYANGVMEAKVSASGYIQGAAYVPANHTDLLTFGDQSQQFSMGNVHDHMVCYKLDLDIGGTANSFLTQLVKTKTFNNLPGIPYQYPMRYLERTFVPTEATSAITAMQPGYYSIVNTAALNKWNTPRGYRIAIMGSSTNMLGAEPIMKANHWSKYQMSVTQRHESEAYATLQWDQNVPQFPLQDFDSFFNGESLNQQDLVVWATVGMQHIPNAEDVPITATAGNGASVLLRPHNYFDEDPSMDLTNSVYITPGMDNKPDSVTRDSQPAPVCAPNNPQFSYSGRTDTDLPRQQY